MEEQNTSKSLLNENLREYLEELLFNQKDRLHFDEFNGSVRLSKKTFSNDDDDEFCLPLFHLFVHSEKDQLNLKLKTYHGKLVEETFIDSNKSEERLKDSVIRFTDKLSLCAGIAECDTGNLSLIKALVRRAILTSNIAIKR